MPDENQNRINVSDFKKGLKTSEQFESKNDLTVVHIKIV